MRLQPELTSERNARFLALLKPVYADCQRWAYSLTQDVVDAEDVLGQSVLTGLSKIHQLKKDGAFKTWMFRIIANTHRLWLRSRKRQPQVMDPESLPQRGPRDDNWAERLDRADTVRRLLGRLSSEQRQALVLFELDGMSIREVSSVMGKKETAVRVLLHRARQRLSDLLKLEGIVPSTGA
jgi:RNA polymerase sigma-70 factor (ECF subfamily)